MSNFTRSQPRQPRGVPVGGQWREMARPEGTVSLQEPEAGDEHLAAPSPAPAPASPPEPAPGPPKRWVNAGLGPIQVKRVNAAISSLSMEGKTVVELTGVFGGETRETVLVDVFGPVRPEVAEARQRIGENFGWRLTPQNHHEVVAALEQAARECKATRRVVDKRITPEEDRERRALVEARHREHRERAEREAALMEEVRAKAPAGAEAVVVAELQEDTSDPMTDYFANKTVRSVAIGYRFGKREDFAQLRHVATSFPETAHLAAKETERRDNYSMGAGNYLSDHGSANSGSGWVVRSYPLRGAGTPRLTEVALPDRPAPPAPVPVCGGQAVVRPSSTGREGFVEVVFAERPPQETLEALKAHGFRWARGNRCWYGRDAAFAETLAGQEATV
jgi:hypothetical protein